MSHAVLIQNVAQATQLDSLNRFAKSASADIDNGNIFYLASKSSATGEGEVWLATQPATGALKFSLRLLNTTYISIADGSIGNQRVTAYEFEVVDNSSNLWMAYEPEVVVTISGSNKFKGIDHDVRNFTNLQGDVFSAFKPIDGDILTVTADGLTGTKSTNTFVVATNGAYTLAWAASANS